MGKKLEKKTLMFTPNTIFNILENIGTIQGVTERIDEKNDAK